MENQQCIGWIWCEQEDYPKVKKNQLVYFRKEFDFEVRPHEMSIKITADAKYKLYVNGQLTAVGPQKGDHHIQFVDTIDLSDQVTKGNNVLVVQVLAIPNSHNKGNHGFHRTDTPGLYVTGQYRIKEKVEFVADASWQYYKADVELLPESQGFAPLYFLEEAKGTACLKGMNRSDFNNEHWRSAKVYSGFELPSTLRPDYLEPRKIPHLFLNPSHFISVERIRESVHDIEVWNRFLTINDPVLIPANTREIIEISADVETTGFLKLCLSQGKNSKIKILTSECYAYEPEGDLGPFNMPKKGDRTDSKHGKLLGFTDIYDVGGYGDHLNKESYEPFWFRTFRYIQLEIVTKDQPLMLHEFSYLQTGYPLDVKTKVMTSDASLEKIWEISERTLRLCMHETYEDCPFYEQLQYAMDSRSQILYTYAVSADDRLARQCMDDFRRATRYDGMINCSYPNYETNVIPGFAIYYIGMVYDHMLYFGDKQLIETHVPTILGILKFFKRNLTSEGIVGKIGGPIFREKYWSFIDWTSQWKETAGVPLATKSGPITMESLLYILGLQYSAKLFEYIGYPDLSEQLIKDAEQVQHAVNQFCKDESGLFLDGPGIFEFSQHTQVFAVLTDTVSSEEGKKYIRASFNDPSKFAQCSVAMMYYVFRALEKCDLYEQTDNLWGIWREMVRKKLTTCEEDPVTSRSDCHAWGALALYELPAVTLGVRPTAPGFSEITVDPPIAHLTEAKGQVITPKGPVAVEWELKNGRRKIRIDAPDTIRIRQEHKNYLNDYTIRSMH